MTQGGHRISALHLSGRLPLVSSLVCWYAEYVPNNAADLPCSPGQIRQEVDWRNCRHPSHTFTKIVHQGIRFLFYDQRVRNEPHKSGSYTMRPTASFSFSVSMPYMQGSDTHTDTHNIVSHLLSAQ